jgi:hypothetical protein
MVASRELTGRHLAQLRYLRAASLIGPRATGAEAATGRRRNRRWRFANCHTLDGTDVRIRDRDRLQQQVRVGMHGFREQLLGRADLAEPAEIHHRDAVADGFDHRKIMRDEQ